MLGQLDLVFTTVIKIFICTCLALYPVAVRGVLGIEVMRQDKVTSAISCVTNIGGGTSILEGS